MQEDFPFIKYQPINLQLLLNSPCNILIAHYCREEGFRTSLGIPSKQLKYQPIPNLQFTQLPLQDSNSQLLQRNKILHFFGNVTKTVKRRDGNSGTSSAFVKQSENCISHQNLFTCLVFYQKIKSQEFTNPTMLGRT